MIHHVTIARLGQSYAHAKHFVGQVDRGLHVASRIFRANKHLIPEGPLKKAGERATTDYDTIRERVRQAALP